MIRIVRFIVASIIILTGLTSCVSVKKALYFNGVENGAIADAPVDLEPVINPNDILKITVSSLNPDASEIFNMSMKNYVAVQNTPTTTQAEGYLVGLDGLIKLPILGDVKAAGLTKKQFEAVITKLLLDRKLLVDPMVNVRYLNFRVSVLGEVAKPSVVTVPSEKISLLEALSLAGDLTVYARRDNVMIIRQENGKKVISRMNLNSSDLLSSPYYYLKSNDVVYVEPNRAKVASTGQAVVWLPVIFSAFTFGIIAVDYLNR
ncbi:polysaccharide biosynthesis/export family protein [Chryseolinea sp. T2]|uniref:polysaccharide biosynthesis/export family protein n=1 Tax=Chryseolinea sp. T2 TaxID=3129255 RepID=UPI0030785A2F